MSPLDTVILAPGAAPLLERVAALAATAGYERETIGSLLVLRGRRSDLERFVLSCAATCSRTEAATTRVLFLDDDVHTATALDVLGPALAADTLAALAARAVHGGMLDALERGGGRAAYQPVVELASGRTVGFEALLRLEHDGRSVPPLDVFRAAADAGRIRTTDAAARRAAIAGAAGWIGRRSLFLNLLPGSIARPDDLDVTEAEVAAAGLDRHQVVFEASIAEAEDLRHLARVFEHLRTRGFGTALDDVTDDRQALDLVGRLRPDTVKISSSLVQALPDLHARSAIATVVGAAHAVGASVSAKGIESAAQLDAVRFVGVDHAQGWEVGQPMRPPTGRPALVS